MVDYKLRLGDGTTFSVDEKGLTTWLQGGLIDDKARVQPAGSKKWFSLKQVLAAQDSQRGHAERQTEKGRADVDRQAAQETAEIERKVAGQRAAEERKATEDLAAAERKAADARTAAERKIIEEREAAVRRAAEERAAAEARAAAERQAEQERVEAERRAAEERAAAQRSDAEAREAARVAEAERLVAAERAERAERKRRADEERLAEQSAAEGHAAAERRAAEERAARERDAAMDAFNVSDLAEPPATEIAIEPAATMIKVEDFERELGLLPVTFADGTGAPSGRESPAVRADRAIQAPSLDRSESRPSSRGEEAASAVVKPPTAVDDAVMRLLKVLDRGVIWVVRSLAPLAGDAIARSVRSLKSAGPKLTNAVPKLKDAVPKLKDAVSKLKGLLARRAKPAEPAPAGDMPAAVSPAAPAPWSPPAPAPVPSAVREAPRKPAMPPPPSQKVEVIPFATTPAAPKTEEEVWDGEDVWEEPGAVASMFAVLWLWVKRVTIATALIVTVALLFLNKEKWLPGAKSAAIVLGQQVDELSDRVPRTVPPEAIEAASAQVPYLRPETIELIMAKSTEGVLAPVEVFRRAHQAAERARPSLPPHIAAEIDHHTAAVAAELDFGEAEQLRAYFATVRAGTPTAAYQDQAAVWLMARGVKRLPAERLARMQELFAQAVNVALQPPA